MHDPNHDTAMDSCEMSNKIYKSKDFVWRASWANSLGKLHLSINSIG